MGLAASQARLLLLTARKSDLEFRAQQITNAEMILAMRTEEVARKYSNALSNQVLKHNTSEEVLTAESITNITGCTIVYSNGNKWDPAYGDISAQELYEGWVLGTIKIIQANGEELDSGNTVITAAYDTSDDAAAEAEYRSATAAIQVKEKRLQMDLQQVETQQKACDQEIESIKKILDKNIQTTFKVFS